MKSKRPLYLFVGGMTLAVLCGGMARMAVVLMGRQPDGNFLVSSGQFIEPAAIAFTGRPIDLAMHPKDEILAILNKSSVLLATKEGVQKGKALNLGANAGFRGLAWSPDGERLFASTDKGYIQVMSYENGLLDMERRIALQPADAKGNPVPGGLCLTRDGRRMYVAAANRNAVVEVDLEKFERVREFPVETLPFEPRLTEDEKSLVVSNWGGRLPREGDRTFMSQNIPMVVDGRGVISTGTISLIDLENGSTRHVEVGLHPTGLAIKGGKAYVANAMSDSVSEVDVAEGRVLRTIPLRWGKHKLFGSMPNALEIRGDTLYAADGGDNALAEVDLAAGKVVGFRPAGYFPTALALSRDGETAFVLNSKGHGSVSKTLVGKPGNAHDFQGTVSVVDLRRDLDQTTRRVAVNNHWDTQPGLLGNKVYNGAIKHVLYIIKENRTYDEVFGDDPRGNGDPKLCSIGEKVMPNHRKLAREFTLFDNGYVSGTNSADGHQWTTQAIANDYLEHFYVGYSRTYPDQGNDPMAHSVGGAIWDAAIAKGRSLRVWGEYCDEKLARIEPKPKDWFEVWDDRINNQGRKFKFTADTRMPSLKPYINRELFFWPLLQSDQHRADVFIREYEQFSREDKVPNLMVMSLPCDHGEGANPIYPTPRAMMADNDLALGRIVEAVSRSPQWKETCIFVIEDDAQAGPDHVDGHRTVFMAISPYSRRKAVDSTFYTTTNMLRSMELMLGLDPMNRFDALSAPMTQCFTDTPDLAPYEAVPNNIPLDERNPSGKKMTEQDKYWLDRTLALDWSHLDGPDPYWLNRINWYSLFKGTRPYPAREGEAPGQEHDEDDDED